MTLLDFEELCGYWQQHPPVHLLVAAYLGVKPQAGPARARASANDESLTDLARHGAFMAGGGWAQGDPHEGLGTPILSYEELKRHYIGQ